jgi:hypothetical protein
MAGKSPSPSEMKTPANTAPSSIAIGMLNAQEHKFE